MKKAKKVLIVLFLAVIMVFGVAGCNMDTQNDLQGKIDDLQSQIAEMEDRLAEMEDQIRERDEKIEQLENELAEKSLGTFYSLQEAYDNGWLTQADIMSIAYYKNRGRTYNEEIMSEDYEPLFKTPEVLSNLTELKIKSAAAKEYREKYDIADAEADGITITQYCGTYGECVAVMIIEKYSQTTTALWTDTVAGVNIHFNNGRAIKIWREDKGKQEELIGSFYTLQEVYDNELLDRNDIMHVSYYLNGSVYEENGTAVDFVPEKALSNLDEKIVNDIKSAYFTTYPKGFQDGEGNYRYGKEILNIRYFGEYNNYYVVIVDSDLWSYGDAVVYFNIGGIVWTMSGAPILVFSYKVA